MDGILEEIIDEHAEHLLRLAYFYVKNRQTAEDIVQEVFIKFSQRDYEERGQLRAYLSTLTINQSKDYLKSWHYRKLLFQEKLFPLQGHKQRDELVAAEERSQIGAAILKLSLAYREPVILYYFEEMKIRDIAQLLGIAENTVKTRLKRAREALKPHLKQEEWEVLGHE
ncbi:MULTISPECIES: sigma-70 family RNA polymerase sigma factor [Lysinibacillus]|uniref:sigma-70 family RNA polymerase sigma factor n=1 Tax=Lysinibacillus TaxID=400634 RepID=UPI000563D092|nr:MULTISPECIES: sigma-70 family RNA polymerase sigma factor [Lysinibacillus]MEE3809796.1 sigma-70 family RNA polymerase sigma factor [Lysinibacillus fusiformis]KUF35648.1 RNA polymerase [Lysinibacillus sp. F5]SCY15355.1 RNA polymerase sigma-70 factor, ECF subfamily [Lysinibacillus sp. SG9]SDB11377.1 RNA polymerase sigma-70 factor, ECF subfamily [Lysinibacillus sp. TC-37]SFS48596.1 RNA polymerase sigma-70 factor, ECF subfamily [Lysinibacillus sp. SG55]